MACLPAEPTSATAGLVAAFRQPREALLVLAAPLVGVAEGYTTTGNGFNLARLTSATSGLMTAVRQLYEALRQGG